MARDPAERFEDRYQAPERAAAYACRSPSRHRSEMAVLDRALRDPVDQNELVSRGLRAQRDWVWRGGRTNPGKGAKMQAKTFFASLAAKLLFFALYTLALVCFLVLVEQMWPHMDISRILHFLQDRIKVPGAGRHPLG